MNLATAEEFRAEIARLQAEVDRLRLAIRRLAEQDATLSACDGNVTVTMDATLTDAEREAVEAILEDPDSAWLADNAATLRGLLERTQFAKRESDRPQPIAKRESDRSQPIECTPEPQSTPAECTYPPKCTETGRK